MAILERRPWIRLTREALEASRREAHSDSAPVGRPASATALVAKMLQWMEQLAEAVAAVEARLDGVEKIMGESSACTAAASTVTGDGTVTPVRNANAERQRRYRARKRAAVRPY